MADLKLGGMFPTPYGVEVEAYRLDPPDPRDPEAFFFSPDAAAICAGIHDPKQRARFVADAKHTGGVGLEQAADYGGFPKLLRLPLSRPAHVADRDIPQDGPATAQGHTCREVVDAWIDRATLHSRWCDRAACLMEMSVRQVNAINGPNVPAMVIGFPLSLILTSVLENLGEKEVDCLEAAAFYALSAHDEWRAVGMEWLRPVRATWWQDWIKARQGYRRVAMIMSVVYDDIPPWLYGRGREISRAA